MDSTIPEPGPLETASRLEESLDATVPGFALSQAPPPLTEAGAEARKAGQHLLPEHSQLTQFLFEAVWAACIGICGALHQAFAERPL